jgi:dTDP-4-amino-4,6-dideoxygalactose transaminase
LNGFPGDPASSRKRPATATPQPCTSRARIRLYLIHLFPAYREPRQSLPRTEALAARLLTLPLYPAMTDAAMRTVVDTLLSCLRE